MVFSVALEKNELRAFQSRALNVRCNLENLQSSQAGWQLYLKLFLFSCSFSRWFGIFVFHAYFSHFHTDLRNAPRSRAECSAHRIRSCCFCVKKISFIPMKARSAPKRTLVRGVVGPDSSDPRRRYRAFKAQTSWQLP